MKKYVITIRRVKDWFGNPSDELLYLGYMDPDIKDAEYYIRFSTIQKAILFDSAEEALKLFDSFNKNYIFSPMVLNKSMFDFTSLAITEIEITEKKSILFDPKWFNGRSLE